jgi:LCP family protein required for cell wall assembly
VSDFDKRNGSRTAGDNRRIFIPPQPGGPATRRVPPQGPPAGRGPVPPLQPRRPDEAPRTRPLGPGGPGGPGGRPGPLPRRGPRPWWKRLKWKRVLGIFAVMLVLLVGGLYWYANSIFNKIEKVEVSSTLSSGGGTNYLIVGSDSAEVLKEGDPAFDPDRPAGQRSDTMMLLRFEDGKAKTLPLPRDLYVKIAETDGSQKLNAAYNGGPTRLIKTITDSLGLPVHRYVEVDFASFGGLVDGLGGVTIDFPHPASDPMTGLNITETGPVELDGDQALAYVRSREYTELIDGKKRKDPTADIGRIDRQQKFLRAVFAEIDGASPLTMLRTAGKVSDGLRIDDKMTMFDAARFALKLRGLQPEPQLLTVTNDRNDAGAVLILDEAASEPVLSQFR